VTLQTDAVLKAIAEALDVDQAKIVRESEIGSVPEWDSLGHLTIVRYLQDTFGVEFTIDDVIECESVQDFIDVLSEATGP